MRSVHVAQSASNTLTHPSARVALACSGLVFGPPLTVGRLLHHAVFRSDTKTMNEATTDDQVELFCGGSEAMAVTSIVIRNNLVITSRSMIAVTRCFWLRKLDASGCKDLECECCVCCVWGGWWGYVRVDVCAHVRAC